MMENGLQQLEYVDRSIDGSSKSMAVYKAVAPSSATGQTEPETLLIVSIRGSKHQVDHMINANHDSKPMDQFLVGHQSFPYTIDWSPLTHCP
jgi:hypothetical protein